MPPADPAGSPPIGFRTEKRPTAESMGEALLGRLLDRAHLIPADLVGPLVAQEVRAIGAADVAIHLQDYDQVHLEPLTGDGLSGERLPIDSSSVGRAFTSDDLVEEKNPDGSVWLRLPMLDGSDRVGVLSLRLPAVNDADRRLGQRLAGLVADLVVTKSAYTDTYARTRAVRPMSLAAELQWATLPPLTMTTPAVDIAGILEPAYDVGGDAFDYALDGHVLSFGVFDAMGHGLEAATMCTLAVAGYRHGRRRDASLPGLYRVMDRTVASSFPGSFATAQIGELEIESGNLTWIPAGHPKPLLVREGRVVGELGEEISRPLGLGDEPRVQSVDLEPGDRVLMFTDGVVEERLDDGVQFGEDRLREMVEATTQEKLPATETVRRLSHALMDARDGQTSDDATLLLIEWKGAPPDEELSRDIPEANPAAGASRRNTG